jgi:hypothetical protein
MYPSKDGFMAASLLPKPFPNSPILTYKKCLVQSATILNNLRNNLLYFVHSLFCSDYYHLPFYSLHPIEIQRTAIRHRHYP